MPAPPSSAHKRSPGRQAQPPLPTPTPAVLRGPDAPADSEEVKPYILGPQIGKGSFATVFKGYHEVSLPLETFSENLTYMRNVGNAADRCNQVDHERQACR